MVQVKQMKLALDAVSLYPEKTECIEFKKKCDDWLETALQTSQGVRDRLVDLESVIVYALSHPDKTAQQVYDACKVSLKVGSIRNMRRAAKREIGEATNVDELIRDGGHHLLGNDGNDILVFGTSAALHYMSVTPIIQCDGTYTCVVLPITQLYIFHAVLGNGVSYPMLYCLVKGKNEGLYVRLLRLIEGIAVAAHKHIFNRPVNVMMDFEMAMINALGRYQAGEQSFAASSTSPLL